MSSLLPGSRSAWHLCAAKVKPRFLDAAHRCAEVCVRLCARAFACTKLAPSLVLRSCNTLRVITSRASRVAPVAAALRDELIA